MGAIGTPATALAALTLILFHGLSKCMLFLDAGIMERVFHVKQTSDMDRLGERGPFAAFVITVGFMSLLLPPFGAFIGKWFSIETLGALAVNERILGALVIVMIACGGAVLSLLYFKVLGLSIARAGDKDKVKFETQSAFYFKPILVLLGLIIAGALTFPFLMIYCFAPVASQALNIPVSITTSGWSLYVGSMVLPVVPLIIAFLLLPATIVLAMFIRFKNVDRAKEYACGEKIDYSFSALYFSTDKATPYFTAIGILFFVALIAVVVL